MTNAAGTTSYRYDAADRLLSAGTTSYAYDNNGNQIAKTMGSTTINYTFDVLNRLTAVTGGGLNSSYEYDGDGNRVRQTAPAGTYQYVNDIAGPLPVVLNENGPDGNIDYLRGLALISETSSAFQYYYEPDGLGSTASITDGTGALKATYSYDPWGKLLTAIDPLGTKNKYKFIGEALDPGTNVYYLRARYYDPGIGRFSAQDPQGANPRDPTSLNRYQYVRSNPVRLIDPSGRTSQDNGASLSTFSAPSMFPLPNTVQNPQFAPPPSGNLAPPCHGTWDCADFVLSGIGTILSGSEAGKVLSFDAFGVQTNRDASSPVALGIDIIGLGLAACSETVCTTAGGAIFVIQTLLAVDSTLPTNGSTPSVASPINPIQMK
jgi:RHS repeat-associated protein